MKIQLVGATTHIDLHGMRMTKEALESAANLTNGDRKPFLGIEHDPTVPPVGKILEAWIEQTEDSEYQLVEVGEVFEEFESATLPDGTVLLKQECETDRHPFVIGDNEAPDEVTMAYDRVNFGDRENRQAFLDEIRNSSEMPFKEAGLFRKSVLPDPEIIIRLSELLVQFLIARKLLDKVGDKVVELAAEELGKFYGFVRSVAIAASKYALPKNRPVTYVFEMPGVPYIEFVACSNDVDLVLSSITQDKLEHALDQANQLHELLQAEKMQFLLDAEGRWEFNYLLTSTGAVLGTPKSFSRRDRRVKLLFQRAELDQPEAEEQ